MAGAIERIISDAIKAAFMNPKELVFILSFKKAMIKAEEKRKEQEERGTHIPPFLIASITSQCNLFCKGCYARANKTCGEDVAKEQLSSNRWAEIMKEASSLGISFILLAGGEPMLRMDVIESAAKQKDIIFPIFTNGTMIGDQYINLFDSNRNLLPIISLEGNREQTDQRRGEGTHLKLHNTMVELKKRKIFFGASITMTTENIVTITSDAFVTHLQESGCKVLFYVEYVPVDGVTKQLAPTDKERKYLDERLLLLRNHNYNLIFLAFPGDEKAVGGCLAAGRGFFHISVNGDAEPCPFSPFSDTNLNNTSLAQALHSPLFKKLEKSGLLFEHHDGGCVLFEQQDKVEQYLK